MENYFTTTEFYILAILVAVTAIALIFHPSKTGEIITYFYKGAISPCVEPSEDPKIKIMALDDGRLAITHTKVPITDDVSISIDIKGHDLRIKEKQFSRGGMEIVGEYCDVMYFIDKLKADRYHLRFESAEEGTSCSTSIINKPPFHTTAELKY